MPFCLRNTDQKNKYVFALNEHFGVKRNKLSLYLRKRHQVLKKIPNLKLNT
jgi:hypothetical protein